MRRTIAFAAAVAVAVTACTSPSDRASDRGPIAQLSSTESESTAGRSETSAESAPDAPGSGPKRPTERTPGVIGQPYVLRDADKGDLTITVTAWLPDANEAIAATNQFNEVAPAGKRYALLGLSVTYRAGTEETSVDGIVFAVGWSLFGSSAVEMNSFDCSAVVPDRLNEMSEILDGGTVAGNVCFLLSDSDAAGPIRLRAEESWCFTNCDEVWIELQ